MYFCSIFLQLNSIHGYISSVNEIQAEMSLLDINFICYFLALLLRHSLILFLQHSSEIQQHTQTVSMYFCSILL